MVGPVLTRALRPFFFGPSQALDCQTPRGPSAVPIRYSPGEVPRAKRTVVQAVANELCNKNMYL